jgi:hypothetical protein
MALSHQVRISRVDGASPPYAVSISKAGAADAAAASAVAGSKPSYTCRIVRCEDGTQKYRVMLINNATGAGAAAGAAAAAAADAQMAFHEKIERDPAGDHKYRVVLGKGAATPGPRAAQAAAEPAAPPALLVAERATTFARDGGSSRP